MLPALLAPAFDAVLPLVVALQVDPTPKPEDVKAGWGAFAIFILLIVAVALLGLSLVKHLRKAEAAKDAGLFGDQPAPNGADDTDGRQG